MSDKFSPLPLNFLLPKVISEIRKNRFFGIPDSLFFRPSIEDPFRMERYGQSLESPVGVAAGPHSQLALNIVAAWLCGARYIELKTIQELDELEVTKPCIDMQDEGYNCEWSQELKIEQSFREYLKAWIIIHILKKELGFTGSLGTIFNMSVGYDLNGIKGKKVQWFFSAMKDCHTFLQEEIALSESFYPDIKSIEIPTCISDSVTLSTMHGCPPDEIEKIGLYLIEEKKLHTTIKLNPTLLGKEELRRILNHTSGFGTEVPDQAFEHDLKYDDAIKILKNLKKASYESGVTFSLKLTNTLESKNKGNFPPTESMMYMSGRALHPISINLALKLQEEFEGDLDISFSAGVDCFNIVETLACGLKPLTVCTDLLKPGGYGRLWQYLETAREEYSKTKSHSIDEYTINLSAKQGIGVKKAALVNLRKYAWEVIGKADYSKDFLDTKSIKTNRELRHFDCIHAPCIDTCPTNQNIPGYLQQIANGNNEKSLEIILETNPFPFVTGMICDHTCQFKCTRIHYDNSLRIRDIKRFAAENSSKSISGSTSVAEPNFQVAVIGAGPAGLSCAWYLRTRGIEVNLYEKEKITGGMIASVIPNFRLSEDYLEKDVQRIIASGVNLLESYKVNSDNFEGIYNDHDALFLAAGAQRSVKLNIDGIDAKGVFDPLDFLNRVKTGKKVQTGDCTIIIGGGNTAIDAARTAYRVSGPESRTILLYRRTIKEMPADKGEIRAALEEGIEIMELCNPETILTNNQNTVTGLRCSRNLLTTAGADGRMIPVKQAGTEFIIPCSTVIPAIGQELDIDFIEKALLKSNKGSYHTLIEKLFIGGDAHRGASTAINAIADGRKAADEILKFLGVQISGESHETCSDRNELQPILHKRAIRIKAVPPAELPLTERKNFNTVLDSITEEEVVAEASRCLRCDVICNVCVTVCPNLANFSYRIDPIRFSLQKINVLSEGLIHIEEDTDFLADQEFQVLNIRDLCNECGNCTTFCPSNGSPYIHKPRICISEEAFRNENDAFFYQRIDNSIQKLTYKNNEKHCSLLLEKDAYTFENEFIKAIINKTDFRLISVSIHKKQEGIHTFALAAEMSLIMQGADQLTHHLTDFITNP